MKQDTIGPERPFGDPVFQRRLKNAAQESRSHARAVTAEAVRRATQAALAARTSIPPVNLHQLAQHLGVGEIIFAPLAMQGRVVKIDDEIVVEINERLDPRLQRFCLAHELSHLILEDDRLHSKEFDDSSFIRDMAHREIERLCDLCADELLLPTAWLHRTLLAEGGGLQAAMHISEQADRSPEEVLSRIISLDLRQWHAIQWSRVRSHIQAIRSVPQWDQAFLVNIDITDENASPVAACLAGAEYAEGSVSLIIAGESQEYWMECVRQEMNDVLSVVYPRKYCEYRRHRERG